MKPTSNSQASVRMGHFAIVAAFILGAVVRTVAAAAPIDVPMTQIGTPAFKIVDVNLFHLGFNMSSLDLMATWLPNHDIVVVESDGHRTLGPRIPYGPPYDTELSEAIAAADIKTGQIYVLGDLGFSTGGVGVAWNQVPNEFANHGATFDYAQGPVLDAYDYTLSMGVFFEGEIVAGEDSTASPNPAAPDGYHYESNGQPINYAGALDSHIPFVRQFGFPDNVLDQFVFVGNWEYRFHVVDGEANGWEFSVPFTVVPEPPTAVLSTAILCIGAWRRRVTRA